MLSGEYILGRVSTGVEDSEQIVTVWHQQQMGQSSSLVIRKSSGYSRGTERYRPRFKSHRSGEEVF